MATTRTYRFSMTVTVEPDQEGFDDPEWIADAAWGSLTNEYGYECAFGDIIELPADEPPTAGSQVPEP
jgi:hypothetical protein